jgi:mutator protein MutT
MQPEGWTPAIRIAIAVVEHEGRFLIGQRPPGVPLAGLWEFPGGKAEPDETLEQAAARECLEETGLEVIVGEEYPPAVHQYDHGLVELHFFHCRPREASQSPRPPYRWVAASRLGEYSFPAANQGLLAQLADRGRRT